MVSAFGNDTFTETRFHVVAALQYASTFNASTSAEGNYSFVLMERVVRFAVESSQQKNREHAINAVKDLFLAMNGDGEESLSKKLEAIVDRFQLGTVWEDTTSFTQSVAAEWRPFFEHAQRHHSGAWAVERYNRVLEFPDRLAELRVSVSGESLFDEREPTFIAMGAQSVPLGLWTMALGARSSTGGPCTGFIYHGALTNIAAKGLAHYFSFVPSVLENHRAQFRRVSEVLAHHVEEGRALLPDQLIKCLWVDPHPGHRAPAIIQELQDSAREVTISICSLDDFNAHIPEGLPHTPTTAYYDGSSRTIYLLDQTLVDQTLGLKNKPELLPEKISRMVWALVHELEHVRHFDTAHRAGRPYNQNRESLIAVEAMARIVAGLWYYQHVSDFETHIAHSLGMGIFQYWATVAGHSA